MHIHYHYKLNIIQLIICFIKNIIFYFIYREWGLGHIYHICDDCICVDNTSNNVLFTVYCIKCNTMWLLPSWLITKKNGNGKVLQCLKCNKQIAYTNIFEILTHEKKCN